jgi:hypothetical protein
MFLTPLLFVCLGSPETRMAATERRGREGGREEGRGGLEYED